MLDFCFKCNIFLNLIQIAKSNQSKIQILLEMSLSSEEEKIVQEYCLKSESAIAQNFLVMYFLCRSRFKEAVSIHYQISYDKKRDEIIEKLVQTIPNLANETSSIKRNFREIPNLIEKEKDHVDSYVFTRNFSEEPLQDSSEKDKKNDEFQQSFRIISEEDTCDYVQIPDASEILLDSSENNAHDDESSSIYEMQQEFFGSSDDRFDIYYFLILGPLNTLKMNLVQYHPFLHNLLVWTLIQLLWLRN